MKSIFAIFTFFFSLSAYSQIIHLPNRDCRQYNNNPRMCENRGCTYNYNNGSCRDGQGGGNIEVEEFNCESQNYRYKECHVWGEVVWATIVRQYSDTDCILNSTFGRYGSTIWVDNGCRARFQVRVRR